jgi:hypothetical protein
MIEILRLSDLTSIKHYPNAVIETIKRSVEILDNAYGAERTRDGDGGLELIVESETELKNVIQSLPFGDLPEVVDEIHERFIRAIYLVSNERSISVMLPKEWATSQMSEVL